MDWVLKKAVRGYLKNFKFSLETFGQLEIKFYFCTRKYGKAQRQKRVAVGSGRKEIIEK
jgi:hypothetical protein